MANVPPPATDWLPLLFVGGIGVALLMQK